MSAHKKEPQDSPETRHQDEPLSAPPVVAFDAIAGGSPEVMIEFDGQLYRLRVTRNGKLILNK